MSNALPPVKNTDAPRLPDGMKMPGFRFLPTTAEYFRETRVPLWCDHDFWKHWKEHKITFLQRGYSIRQSEGIWWIQQHLAGKPGAHTLTARGASVLGNVLLPQQTELPLLAIEEPLDLEPLPQWIEDKLWHYQITPARQLYRALKFGKEEWGYPGAVDLSYGGTGKTFMDYAAALATGRKPVILCPKVGADGWERATKHFGVDPEFIGTYEAVRGKWRPAVVIWDDERNRFDWVDPHDRVLILDEGQYVRHDDSLTSYCCSAAIRQGIPIILASATIAVDITELRFAGRITGLHSGGDDWPRFLRDHGCVKNGSTWVSDKKAHHLHRIHEKLFPRRGCRVQLADLGDKCPETTIDQLALDCPEAREINRHWMEAQYTIAKLTKQGGNKARIAMVRQRAYVKLLQDSENALVSMIAARVRQDVRDGWSVAVFMKWDPSRRAMGKLLNTNAGFYGGQPAKVRQYWEREFQADRQHILISNIAAGGASVSLHDVTGWRRRRSYIFPSHNPIEMEQATYRVSRAGEKSHSEQFLVCVKNTVLEQILRSTRAKLNRLAALNDGSGAELNRI